MSKIKFSDLGLSRELLEGIEKKGYEYPSPIQAAVIPLLLKGEKDIIGQAQTGTGKTASFGIPLLERLDNSSKDVKGIVLCPTRELAIQVAEEIASFSSKKSLKITLLYGGQPIRDEMRELKSGPTLVIGTPGRVKDHLSKGRLKLDNLEYFVLDEADEMLNIGFREEIDEIMRETPKNKKVLLFSATMPKAIMNIVNSYMGEYDLVSIKSENKTNKDIEQKYYEVSRHNKFDALCRIIETEQDFYSIIFCRTKSDVDDVASKLMGKGYLAEGIHGDIEQKMREKILSRFKNGQSKILVATDVAARGIDVNNITHVINYSLPENPEVYTHRIGRTGRAGNKGTAITFVMPSERRKIYFFENRIKSKIAKATLPSVKQVIENKKQHLIEGIKTLIDSSEAKQYMDLAKELLQVEDDVTVLLSALIKKVYGVEFDEFSYSDIKNSPTREDKGSSRKTYGDGNGITRLFIAKGKKDNMNNPGKVLGFLGGETDMEMKNAGKIEIYNNFSYIDMPEREAEIILDVFKQKNSRKPVVVKAKSRQKSGGRRRY